MPSYKLVYFNGRGRAETTRLAFAASGISYEDYRIQKEQWPEMKPKTFAGYLPALEVDGKVLVESMAIARYVAREGGLVGKCSFEQAQVDSVVDIISGLLEKGAPVRHSPEGPQKEALFKDFMEKTVPNVFKLLEKFLGDDHFFVGNKLSLADLHFYSVIESIISFYHDWPKASPKLKEHYDRVASQPKIAEYLKTRPETPF